MVQMYTLNEEGVLQIIDVPFKDALQIMYGFPNFDNKYKGFGFKFLTMEEFEECSKMDNEQRKLYYEMKED